MQMFQTQRLIMRTITADDWSSFYRLAISCTANQYVRDIASDADIEQKFQQRLQPFKYESGDWLSLVIVRKDNNEFVGITGFYCQDDKSQRAEVGYMLCPSQAGQGFATESLQALLKWGAEQYQIRKYVATCASQNVASLRVLKKCQFEIEGELKQHTLIGDTLYDDCLLGRLM